MATAHTRPARAWGPRRIAAATAKALSASGYVLFGTILCFGCTGLPVVSGLLGGLAVGARFGVSAGVVSAVVLTWALVRRARRRGREACALPAGAASPPGAARARPQQELRASPGSISQVSSPVPPLAKPPPRRSTASR